MSLALTPGLQVSSRTQVARLRELPVSGEVLVKPGDHVESSQVIARAALPGELYILRVSESLGVEPFEVMNGLKVKVGDEVSEGQLLCEHVGLFGIFRSRFIAPVSGVVDLITEATGHIGLRLPARDIVLDAYLSGTVLKVEEGKSVVIEADGAFLQGIFGIGGERHGKIRVFAKADQLLEESSIPANCRGEILVGGMRPTAEALSLAAAGGATGMVVGSIDDDALASYLGYDLGIALTGDEDVSMSIIVTEGFGSLPISERAFKLLHDMDGRAASLNGATQVRAGAVRPEIIIPFEQEEQNRKSIAETSAAGLSVGAKIRIIRVPYFGMQAVVEELPPKAEKIPTGAETRVLRARLENGEIVTVPRANVELLS